MVRMLVLSDSHNNTNGLLNILKRNRNVDYIIHLGDYVRDAETIEKTFRYNIIKVRGNGDFTTRYPNEKIIAHEGVRILLTHGHKQHVKSGLLRLQLLAQERQVQLVLYGHTHIPSIDRSGVLMVNPGAVMLYQYAIVTIDDGAISIKHHEI